MSFKRQIEERVHGAIFGHPVIGNTLRGLVAEAIIAEAIERHGWDWVAADWSSWDFEHRDTWVTMEVKQSAALQPWSAQYTQAPNPRFDIGYRTGYWYQEEDSDKIEWWEERCRPADVFVFAWHGVSGAVADQRDPTQWEFLPVSTEALPTEQGSIGLERLKRIVPPCRWHELSERLSVNAASIKHPRQRRA